MTAAKVLTGFTPVLLLCTLVRIDGWISMPWLFVFTPALIVGLGAVADGITRTFLYLKNQVKRGAERQNTEEAIMEIYFYVPLLIFNVFLILLARKLDANAEAQSHSWIVTFIPLWISFLLCLVSSPKSLSQLQFNFSSHNPPISRQFFLVISFRNFLTIFGVLSLLLALSLESIISPQVVVSVAWILVAISFLFCVSFFNTEERIILVPTLCIVLYLVTLMYKFTGGLPWVPYLIVLLPISVGICYFLCDYLL